MPPEGVAERPQRHADQDRGGDPEDLYRRPTLTAPFRSQRLIGLQLCDRLWASEAWLQILAARSLNLFGEGNFSSSWIGLQLQQPFRGLGILSERRERVERAPGAVD